jgi:hypothetical protein
MHQYFILSVWLMVVLAGCSKSKTPTATMNAELIKGSIDACALLTSKEIESIQGEPVKETQPSRKTETGFAISQCYFTLPASANSITLTIVRKGEGAESRDPKQYWKEKFHRDMDNDNGREEGGKRSAPPEKITSLGDEAFWMGDLVGGALYVLKDNSYIRISVGGANDQASKMKKSKMLAEMILKRF